MKRSDAASGVTRKKMKINKKCHKNNELKLISELGRIPPEREHKQVFARAHLNYGYLISNLCSRATECLLQRSPLMSPEPPGI